MRYCDPWDCLGVALKKNLDNLLPHAESDRSILEDVEESAAYKARLQVLELSFDLSCFWHYCVQVLRRTRATSNLELEHKYWLVQLAAKLVLHSRSCCEGMWQSMGQPPFV